MSAPTCLPLRRATVSATLLSLAGAPISHMWRRNRTRPHFEGSVQETGRRK